MKTLDEKVSMVSNEINVDSPSHNYNLSWEYLFTAYFLHQFKKTLNWLKWASIQMPIVFDPKFP